MRMTRLVLLQTSEMLCRKISKINCIMIFFWEKHAGNIRKCYRNIGNNKGKNCNKLKRFNELSKHFAIKASAKFITEILTVNPRTATSILENK